MNRVLVVLFAWNGIISARPTEIQTIWVRYVPSWSMRTGIVHVSLASSRFVDCVVCTLIDLRVLATAIWRECACTSIMGLYVDPKWSHDLFAPMSHPIAFTLYAQNYQQFSNWFLIDAMESKSFTTSSSWCWRKVVRVHWTCCHNANHLLAHVFWCMFATFHIILAWA